MNCENEKQEKKVYEKPTVQKVEFDFSEVITASGCEWCTDAEQNLVPAAGPFNKDF